jgi:lipopolysaccharide biosynthesis regulator YciM
MVQELYLEAYQNEYSGEFSDAIEIYKDIVSDYKDSSYASSCLSRIFNCYEKKSAIPSEFSALQSYYTNISNDTSYSEIQRNISEDFMIKSKVNKIT